MKSYQLQRKTYGDQVRQVSQRGSLNQQEMSKCGWRSVCRLSFRLRSVLFHHNNYLMPINVIVFFPIIKVTVDDSRLHKDINRSEKQTESKVYQLFYKFSLAVQKGSLNSNELIQTKNSKVFYYQQGANPMTSLLFFSTTNLP